MYYDSNSQKWFNSQYDYLVSDFCYTPGNGVMLNSTNAILDEIRELKALVQQLLKAQGSAQ
jgi:hypothetical protein